MRQTSKGFMVRRPRVVEEDQQPNDWIGMPILYWKQIGGVSDSVVHGAATVSDFDINNNMVPAWIPWMLANNHMKGPKGQDVPF